jgi:hypothetical protein
MGSLFDFMGAELVLSLSFPSIDPRSRWRAGVIAGWKRLHETHLDTRRTNTRPPVHFLAERREPCRHHRPDLSLRPRVLDCCRPRVLEVGGRPRHRGHERDARDKFGIG